MKKLSLGLIALTAVGAALKTFKSHLKQLEEYKQFKREYIYLKKRQLENNNIDAVDLKAGDINIESFAKELSNLNRRRTHSL